MCLRKRELTLPDHKSFGSCLKLPMASWSDPGSSEVELRNRGSWAVGMCTSDRPVLVIFLQDDSHRSGRKSKGTPPRLCRTWSFSPWPCCSEHLAAPTGGGMPGRELGWEAGSEVKVPCCSWLLQHFQPQDFSLRQQSITERSLCVDCEILIVCPPHFNCISERAKLSQCRAA